MYERGTSSMGGQMNDELQRFKTFDQWPHSESSHPGVTPTILAAEGFHFCPTAQDPDTVICFFCDLQVLLRITTFLARAPAGTRATYRHTVV